MRDFGPYCRTVQTTGLDVWALRSEVSFGQFGKRHFGTGAEMSALAYGRFPDWTFPVQDDSRTRRFSPDISRTRRMFPVHLERESSFWKSVFIVTSAYNILSLIQLCKHSFLTVSLNTLSQVTAA